MDEALERSPRLPHIRPVAITFNGKQSVDGLAFPDGF
jgi:hypothetical protein